MNEQILDRCRAVFETYDETQCIDGRFSCAWMRKSAV